MVKFLELFVALLVVADAVPELRRRRGCLRPDSEQVPKLVVADSHPVDWLLKGGALLIAKQQQSLLGFIYG